MKDYGDSDAEGENDGTGCGRVEGDGGVSCFSN